AHLRARQLAQPAQPARQLAAGRLALGSEQEAHHRPDPETEQEGPEPGAALAHSPASRSSGAATATARGSAWDCSGGRTKRSTTARASVPRRCSNRTATVLYKAADTPSRTEAERTHSRRLK